MPLPSQSPRQMHGGRRQMSSRRSKGPGPIALAAVVGLCGLGLAYVVFRPMFVGPSRAGAAPDGGGPGQASGTTQGTNPGAVREPLNGGSGTPRQTASQPPAPSLENVVDNARREGRLASSTPANQGGTPSNQTTGGTREPITPAPSGTNAPPPGPAPVFADSVATALRAAEGEQAANRPVVARQILLRALSTQPVADLDRSRLREAISKLNDEIVFSSKVFPDDQFSLSYVVQGGDSLSRIASRQGLGVDWRLIQRINRMSSETIRVGQALKLVRGPFHAVVDKSDFRLDLYAGPPDSRDEWTFIRSFSVGLGDPAQSSETPLGEFTVKRNSRLINPHWVNPRTGERFDKDDPMNPIGERWVGFRGLGQYEVIEGIGLHGTIDPSSIGQQKSMGCIRMGSGDVELVYELMAEEVSRILIEP